MLKIEPGKRSDLKNLEFFQALFPNSHVTANGDDIVIYNSQFFRRSHEYSLNDLFD